MEKWRDGERMRGFALLRIFEFCGDTKTRKSRVLTRESGRFHDSWQRFGNIFHYSNKRELSDFK